MVDDGLGADGRVDSELAALAQRLRESTVRIAAPSGHGSGLVIDDEGTIVTNAHVAGGQRANVITPDGRERPATIAGRSQRRDLAVLKTKPLGLPPASFRDARTLRPGEIVFAVGNPLDTVGAVVGGVVHSRDARGLRVWADVRLLPGNSGGPLADARGQVVGINAMVVDGLAVAIAWESVRRFLAAPNAQPYVGVTTQAVAADIMGERRIGMLVVDTAARGTAARAGVVPGDVLIGVNGRLFRTLGDLGDEIDAFDVGTKIRLDLLRAGRVTGVDVAIADAALEHDSAA